MKIFRRPLVPVYLLVTLLACLGSLTSPARQSGAGNTLPDPLVFNDGSRVASPEQWHDRRRAELLELFEREMYGRAPAKPANLKFIVFDDDPQALGGLATRRQITLLFTGGSNGPKADLLLYLPNQVKGPAPTILGLNFWGNSAIHPDPGIRLVRGRLETNLNAYVDASCVSNGVATEACRGINSRQWPVEKILSRGYALATMYRNDIAPDRFDGFTNSLHAAFPELQSRGDNFTTIGAWAWALSRAMDYLETDPRVDAKRVALFGWSRLGKTALWAGARDERFALVFCHESGAGGAKLFRRGVGESITRLNTVFPHWFCGNFRKYNEQDIRLPFDQHMVIALVAPRPIYIGSAWDDKNADPEGEFAGARAASFVYRFLGTEGLPDSPWPAVDHSIQGRIGYHVRTGKHDVTEFDWIQYLEFADKYLQR